MKHFKVFELVPRCTYEEQGDEAIKLFTSESLQMLDDYAEYWGVPIVVNNWHAGGLFEHRGWRSIGDEMQANPNSKGHSAHQICCAFDSDVHGVTAEQARARILADKDNPLLQRITRLEGGVNWVHLDCMTLAPGVDRIHVFNS